MGSAVQYLQDKHGLDKPTAVREFKNIWANATEPPDDDPVWVREKQNIVISLRLMISEWDAS